MNAIDPLGGRTAIVTGGSSGIGLATTIALARAGARVVIAARTQARLDAACAEVESANGPGCAAGAATDVRREADVTALVEFARKRFGPVDILICCAGVDAGRDERLGVPRPVAQLGSAAWRAVLDTNLRGTFLANRAVLPEMTSRRSGEIVNVSSWPAGTQGQPLAAAYSASKFAVNGLSEALAEEVGPRGVRVHVVAPGLVETPLTRESTLSRRLGPGLAAGVVADYIAHLVSMPDDVILSTSRRFGLPALRSPRSSAAAGADSGRVPARRAGGSSDNGARSRNGLGATVITGAGSGIGRATAIALARRGSPLVLADTSADGMQETRRLVLDAVPDAEVRWRTVDVRDEHEMAGMTEMALAEHGAIDVLVASAGILRARDSGPRPVSELEAREWDEVVDTNLTGVFLSNRAVLPAMLAARSGQIVNVASLAGREGRALDAPYCASKAGVIGLSESLAEEVGRAGIRVAAVLPDVVDTPLWEQNLPLPRPREILDPRRVAEAIAFMLDLPAEAALGSPVIRPFAGRARAGPRSLEHRVEAVAR